MGTFQFVQFWTRRSTFTFLTDTRSGNIAGGNGSQETKVEASRSKMIPRGTSYDFSLQNCRDPKHQRFVYYDSPIREYSRVFTFKQESRELISEIYNNPSSILQTLHACHRTDRDFGTDPKITDRKYFEPRRVIDRVDLRHFSVPRRRLISV